MSTHFNKTIKTMNYLLALISPFLYATGNIIDSYLVSKYGNKVEGSIIGLILISSFFSIVLLIPLFCIFYSEICEINILSILLLVFSGIISMTSIIAYLYALAEDNATAVTVWWQIIPFFSCVLGYIFLGEQITNIQILGGLLVVSGAILVGSEVFNVKELFNKKVFFLMIIASLLYSIVGLLFKIGTLESHSFWVSSFYENIGVLLVGVFIFAFSSKSRFTFFTVFKIDKKQLIVLNSINELIFIGATLITQFVILSIPLVISSIINGLTPLFVFIFSLIFAFFFPETIKDINISRKDIYKNSFGLIISLIGLILLT